MKITFKLLNAVIISTLLVSCADSPTNADWDAHVKQRADALAAKNSSITTYSSSKDISSSSDNLSSSSSQIELSSFDWSKCESAGLCGKLTTGEQWVKIGTQYWLAQNRNVGIIVDLPTSVAITVTQTDDTQIEKYCAGNLEENCYDAVLYTWAEAMQLPNSCNESVCDPGAIQGICPENWFIPTIDDYNSLIAYVKQQTGLINYLPSLIGTQKFEFAENWLGTDIFGFILNPVGIFDITNFNLLSVSQISQTYLWTSTSVAGDEFKTTAASFNLIKGEIEFVDVSKKNGIPVRCISIGVPQ